MGELDSGLLVDEDLRAMDVDSLGYWVLKFG